MKYSRSYFFEPNSITAKLMIFFVRRYLKSSYMSGNQFKAIKFIQSTGETNGFNRAQKQAEEAISNLRLN